VNEPALGSAAGDDARFARRLRSSRRRLRRRIVLALVLVLLAPVAYSYTTTMLQPSSLPLGIRSIEWLRANHGAWLVDTIEHYWYTWHAPKRGGPALKQLPPVGRAVARPPRVSGRRRAALAWRPARLRALIRPALPGEGSWHVVGPNVEGGPPLLVTTFRPDAAYPRVVAYVAWIDHKRTQLGLYPGRYEPPGASPRGPMEVPQGQRWRLLATFNSGFTYRDGHGGFSVNGKTPVPLRVGLGTVVAYRNGAVDVVSWRGAAVPGPRVVLARQNLPLIVIRGRLNSSLSDGSLWGATLGNAVRVWRSAVGIDARGNLIYAAADAQTAQSLGRILIHAGAVRAIELDINAEWPSFINYSHARGLYPVKLVPNGQQPATRYLVPDDRDFFAVYRRLTGRALHVPFG
jgi:hypothetical protein